MTKNKLIEQLINETLLSPILLNSRVFLFPILEKETKLVINLSHHQPELFIIEKTDFYLSFSSTFLDSLKNYLKESKIKNVSFFNNDTVIEISFYEKSIKLIIELIRYKPNLILTDENYIIIDAYFANNERIKINKKYIKEDKEQKPHSFIDENEINNYFQKEIDNREKEKYAYFTTYLTSRIKRVNRKISNISNDKEKAMNNLLFQEYADKMYCLNLDLNSHQQQVEIDNTIIPLDKSKKVIENIESFYKIAKKARQTILLSEKNINEAQIEKNNYLTILDNFNKAQSEKEKEKIILESNFFKKKKEIIATPYNQPYKINYKGTIIYFGKNASQNDYLTFVKKLDREFYYLHIKDKSGSHIIIANKKPTEKELIIASNIALISSYVTTGEIIYTKKKNVRRGKTLGEAILKNYSTIKINNLEEEAYNIYNSAIRTN